MLLSPLVLVDSTRWANAITEVSRKYYHACFHTDVIKHTFSSAGFTPITNLCADCAHMFVLDLWSFCQALWRIRVKVLIEWLCNDGPYELIVLYFLFGVACYMSHEWELSFCLGICPWIVVAYPALVAAATTVFLIYPISQGNFSDNMPLGVSEYQTYLLPPPTQWLSGFGSDMG